MINLIVDEQQPEKSFERIAKELFSRHHLVTSIGEYYLTEIEFYYGSDPFLHGYETQLLNGFWYFHWSGIDITIGDGLKKGGILLRGVKRWTKENLWQFIDGPLNVMRELLSGQQSISNEFGFLLQLKLSEKERMDEIYCGKRVGLNDNLDPEGKYRDGSFRFLIDKNITRHKFIGKGRVFELVY